jgi:hypothetical protein
MVKEVEMSTIEGNAVEEIASIVEVLKSSYVATEAEHAWLAVRQEAFARYLREDWPRMDPEVLAEHAEFVSDGYVLTLSTSWDDPTAEAREDEEHRGHGCGRDPESPGYVVPV